MAKLKSLAKLVKVSKENSVADSFINDLVYTIEQESRSDRVPTLSFKPSGIGGCIRSLYYQLKGETPDGDSTGYNLVGIGESGTDRHERIQKAIMKMKDNSINCEWLDIETYLKEKGIEDLVVIDKKGNETKLFSKKYNMRFLCDGLVRYNGSYYIIEIKTETSFKFSKHLEPWEDHKLQATCYSMNLKVDKVIFIYENRDDCQKKGYLVTITDDMIKRVENIIDTVNYHLGEEKVPPRCEDKNKCRYCNYKKTCSRDKGGIE